MSGFYLIIKAIMTGLLTGLLIAIPLGPSGIESVKRTMSKGYREGMLVAIGAVGADALDIILINFGLFNSLRGHKALEACFWVICGIILLFIGYISFKSAKSGDMVRYGFLRNDRIKSMPVLTGFLITFSNPMTHSLWITLSGTVVRVWHLAGTGPYYAFIFSILAGMVIWFMLLNYLVLHGKNITKSSVSEKIPAYLAIAIMIIGAAFIIFGLGRLILS